MLPLIGYVSDERYVALTDAVLEFINAAGESWEAQSRASGAVYVHLPDGVYKVIIQKPGFGAKFSNITLPVERPHHFRLLSDCLLGYAWPKWVRSGEHSEFRVHSVEPYKLELWRYGASPEFVRALGWHDEHGPRAVMQITPDGDYTRTGAEWNKVGHANSVHSQFVPAPDAAAVCTTFGLRPRAANGSVSPGSLRSAETGREDCGVSVEHHLERVQLVRRAQQLHPRRWTSPNAHGQLAGGTQTLF